jgi:hypothetical protein
MADLCTFTANRICSKKADVIGFHIEWRGEVKSEDHETLQTIKHRANRRENSWQWFLSAMRQPPARYLD